MSHSDKRHEGVVSGWVGRESGVTKWETGEIGVVFNDALIHEHGSSSMIMADCSVIHGPQRELLCTIIHKLRQWK